MERQLLHVRERVRPVRRPDPGGPRGTEGRIGCKSTDIDARGEEKTGDVAVGGEGYRGIGVR